jgi:hypothetical protein
MAARDRDDIGTGAMEIAFDARAFAIAGFRNSQPLQTAMIAMSILAMVICLFGGYVDSPDEHPDQHGGPDYLPKHSFTNRSNDKENMIMNAKCRAIAAWDFSRWFAVLSPLIGILLGFVGAFFVLH